MSKGRSFPLRFESEATRSALHEMSDLLGVSMNKLAQDAILVHLNLVGTVLEGRLERTLALLRQHRGRWSDDEIAEFARSEIEHDDPANGTMVDDATRDPFAGVSALARSLER